MEETPRQAGLGTDQVDGTAPAASHQLALLQSRLANSLVACHEEGSDVRLEIAPAGLVGACRILRDDPNLAYDYPADLAAYDTGTEIVLWYRLYSTSHCRNAVLVVTLDRMDPVVASLVDVWPGLNWFERECYDLYGVEFEGHPNSGDPTLMRILLPKTWQGFPFRKDYRPVFLGDPLQGPQEPN